MLGDLRWVRSGDPLLTVLESTRENLNPIVDLRFSTRPVRWLTLRAFPLRDYEIAEFEIYGGGYVHETTYLTPILDFGQAVTWGKIRWEGDMPAGTRIEIRTRTGHTPDPLLYFAPNVNDDLIPITHAEHANIDIAARLVPTYDADNWSFWSSPYEFAAGLRDPDQPASAWQDGMPAVVARTQPIHPTRHQAVRRPPCGTAPGPTHLAVERNPVGAGARRRNLAYRGGLL